MNRKTLTKDLSLVKDDIFYRVADLKAILENLGLNYSIFSIRDAETWKCLNYKCGKRYTENVQSCTICGGAIRVPSIPSPRTRGGGKGIGHRIYSGTEIKRIVRVFKQRA